MTGADSTSLPCPFCDITQLAVSIESRHFIAVCNKFPTVEGHCLIVPKRHVEQYLDLDDNETIDLTKISRQLIAALLAAYQTEAFDYALQEGGPAGRSIRHLHFHVIPRKAGDLSSPGDWYPELVRQHIDPAYRSRLELEPGKMKEVANRIRTHAGNDQGH